MIKEREQEKDSGVERTTTQNNKKEKRSAFGFWIFSSPGFSRLCLACGHWPRKGTVYEKKRDRMHGTSTYSSEDNVGLCERPPLDRR
eukprot:scaffold219_cov156-Amphora_coffeaeformis.AAC.8